jgi:hypothetical protein
LEGKKTEPNRTKINRFEPVFGSVRFKKLKKNNSVWLFILVQNRNEPEMLSPSCTWTGCVHKKVFFLQHFQNSTLADDKLSREFNYRTGP